jgi:hypothetical protein
MIIFDLDGTLADCEHRRYLIDPAKNEEYLPIWSENDQEAHWCHNITLKKFQPDYKSFYESCCEDKPNHPVITVFHALNESEHEIEIWSGRSESVRSKTENWLWKHVGCGFSEDFTWPQVLKMRPVNDSTPDEILKEQWLDEVLLKGKKVFMVFDDRQKVVDMWRRRGITCFQVAPGNF